MQLRARVEEVIPDEREACIASYVNVRPLDPSEESHRLDFVADEADPERAKSSVLAVFVRAFQGLFLISAPPESPLSLPHVVAPSRSSPRLAEATALFDRLAGYYAEKYRGSVILVYLLGSIGVLTALSAAILPRMQGWTNTTAVVCLSTEFVLLVVMFLVHVRGHSGPPGVATGSPHRLRTRRWHERWLDYRGLAERFRYAELHMLSRQQGESPEASPAGDWCTRYFQQELARTATQASAEYHAEFLLFAIDEQQRYHHHNGHVCRVLSHRLHVATAWIFSLAVAGVLIELASKWCDILPAGHYSTAGICFRHEADFWLYVTAGFPAFAAALHGIQSACEWSKLARSSIAIEHALGELRMKLEALQACSHHFAGQEDALNSITAHFLQITSDDLTGWRTTFSDKNVPLVV